MMNGFGDPAQIERLRGRASCRVGVRVAYSGADISKPDQIAALVSQTERELGRVDILVNNAGVQFTANIEEFPRG